MLGVVDFFVVTARRLPSAFTDAGAALAGGFEGLDVTADDDVV